MVDTVVVSDGRQPYEITLPAAVAAAAARTEPPVRLAGSVADFFEALGKLA